VIEIVAPDERFSPVASDASMVSSNTDPALPVNWVNVGIQYGVTLPVKVLATDPALLVAVTVIVNGPPTCVEPAIRPVPVLKVNPVGSVPEVIA
jgi:hypothetical protein